MSANAARQAEDSVHAGSVRHVLDVAGGDIAVARAAIADTVDFVRDRARPWFESEGLAVGEEPTVVHEAGVLAVDLAAAEASLARAQEHAQGNDPLAAASAAETRGLAGTVALKAASFLFAAGGTSAADDPGDFGRHWRAANTSTVLHPLHDAFVAAGRTALARSPVVHEPFSEGDRPATHKDAFERSHRVAAALRQTAADHDRNGTGIQSALGLLARSGLLGVGVPEAFGGIGLSYGGCMEISRILSHGDASVGQISTIHYAMVELLIRVGTPDQRQTWFPQFLAGARAGNAAAERGVAHAKITATRLSRDGEAGFRLNGRKFYSTGAPGAALIVVLAVDDDGKAISVIVPRDAPGLTVLDDWHGLGQRGTGSGTTILDNIAIPETAVLPRWLSADQPNVGTAAANLAHVGIDLGIARAALDDTLSLLRQRGDAGDDTRVLHQIGQLSAKLNASEQLFADALARLNDLRDVKLTTDLTQALSLQVSIAKVHAGELAVEIGQAVFTLTGPEALDPALGLDRHWRNARTHTLHDPSRWRYLRAGDHLLNGRLPPRNRSS